MVRAQRFSVAGERFAVISFPIDTALPPGLSDAERDVVRLLLAGLSNGDIAKRRRVAIRTVANQVASSFRKLGVRSRAELITRLS